MDLAVRALRKQRAEPCNHLKFFGFTCLPRLYVDLNLRAHKLRVRVENRLHIVRQEPRHLLRRAAHELAHIEYRRETLLGQTEAFVREKQ